MKKLFKRVIRVIFIIRAYLFKNECALLRIIEQEALDYLDLCKKMDVTNIEEVEDLVFHIRAYFDIPVTLKNTMFSDIPTGIKFRVKKNTVVVPEKYKGLLDRYAEYLTEVEKQRAVERLCILECLKSFPFSSVI